MNRMLVAAALIMTSVPAAAEEATNPPPAVAEALSQGLWRTDLGGFLSGLKGSIEFGDPTLAIPDPPPLTPAWQERYDRNRAAAIRGEPAFDPNVDCSPWGVPLVLSAGLFEFAFGPGVTYMIYEGVSGVRRIYTDGREHPDPEEREPQYNGYSVGRWEGDTLVVDTVGLRDVNSIEIGLEHTLDLRVVERWRLLGPDKLETRITMTDPEVFSKPWEVVATWSRMGDWRIMDAICVENNRSAQVDGKTVLLDADGKPLGAEP